MKIIYTTYFPLKGYAAINLLGVIFARKEFSPLSYKISNHEAIHTAQMKELVYLIFYIWYGVEWVVRLCQYRNTKQAYYNISFEREAYKHEFDLGYLKNRKLFSFKKYLRII